MVIYLWKATLHQGHLEGLQEDEQEADGGQWLPPQFQELLAQFRGVEQMDRPGITHTMEMVIFLVLNVPKNLIHHT